MAEFMRIEDLRSLSIRSGFLNRVTDMSVEQRQLDLGRR